MTRFVVGVDGGGTRTRAVVLDEHGEERGRAQVTGAVLEEGDPHPAVHAVVEAVRSAAAAAGCSLPAAALWAGLAGAGREEAREALARRLAGQKLARRVEIGTDVEPAFYDAFAEGPGILLVAGTGSIAWARSERREDLRVGGWGRQLGDEGSGYDLGMRALRRIVRAEDGRGAPTALTDAVLGRLGIVDPEALVAWIAGATKAEVASLAPVVAQVAEDGDEVAAAVVGRAVDALEALLVASLRRAGPWSAPARLALWGGLVWKGGPLRDAFVERVSAHPVELLERALDPPRGAARLALGVME